MERIESGEWSDRDLSTRPTSGEKPGDAVQWPRNEFVPACDQPATPSGSGWLKVLVATATLLLSVAATEAAFLLLAVRCIHS